MRQLAVSLPYPFIEQCLKGLYLSYAIASRTTSRPALPRLVLMASCFVDLCAVDQEAAYRHAFVNIRQLAIHLRNAMQKATPEASRQVYNWQYINCLRLWAQVLCTQARSATAPLRQLVYPLVQVCLGTARLVPSIRHAPLRLQCARILNQISSELQVYIPVAPLLVEALQFAELSKTPRCATSDKPLDWATMLKVTATECSKRVYQEGLIAEALYLLAEHFHSLCASIAFPEVVSRTVLALRTTAKSTQIIALQKRCKSLLAQMEGQASYVAQRRDAVEFALAGGTGNLVTERGVNSTPFGKWFGGERAHLHRAEAQRQQHADAIAAGVTAKSAQGRLPRVEQRAARRRSFENTVQSAAAVNY